MVPQICRQFDVRIQIVHPLAIRRFHSVPVLELPLIKKGYEAILGRDVLSECLFIYDGQSKQFTLSF